MAYTVQIIVGELVKRIEASPGQSLYEILTSVPDAPLDSPCGGKGKCGKCKLIVEEGEVSPVADQEKRLLSEPELAHGVRLACLTYPKGEVRVRLRETASAHIMVSGVEYGAEVIPNVRKTAVKLAAPSLEDQRDDFTRLSDALGKENFHIPIEELRSLPLTMKDADYSVTAVHDGDTIITVEPGDTSGKNYGIAVDIGTTTVVAYLVDLTTGKTVDTASALNAQKPHGQDVISRISYTMENESGTAGLRERIINQINSLVRDLASRNSIDIDTIYSIALAGNTTMMHLAAGIPPRNLAVAPFIPVVKRAMRYPAGDLGLGVHRFASAHLLPGISAYVGADIVADVLSSGLFYGEALSLLIAVGTNGEIVLGSRDRLLCCSTAAGPAFEGATIRYGMGGVSGAIDTVNFDAGGITYTTIDGGPPVGICGSGIIDAVAMLLVSGAADETGRLLAPEDGSEHVPAGASGNAPEDAPADTQAGGHAALDGYFTRFEDRPAVILAPESDSNTGEAIILTQKDVREVQLAKAAIAAGIMTLLSHAGKQVEDIDVVYLAGGFGSFINKESAVRIGLIPEALKGKIQVLGNAAGTGAVFSLVSTKSLAECDRIAASAEYIELSVSPEFQEQYFNAMMFPTP